jgi:[acyl-carrier-protein] S-malonyltransferase
VLHSKGFSGRALALPVSAPFHCSLMAPAADILKPALDAVNFKKPCIKVISNVTQKPYNNVEEIKLLLKRQMYETVQWRRSMQYAKEGSVNNWIVVGPARVLSNIVRKEYPMDVVKYIFRFT